ncbi:MAG: hypothetical protein Q8O29_06585 [Polaromonas sp.]|nr:hypothetical protein [Polaromonas sp.]
MKVADETARGRVVSVREGGYSLGPDQRHGGAGARAEGRLRGGCGRGAPLK